MHKPLSCGARVWIEMDTDTSDVELIVREMTLELKHADCLEYLKTLKDKSVDLVVVDPPYFEIVRDDWDNQWASEQEYLNWCKEWTEECFRVMKDDTCFYVWGTQNLTRF